MPYKRRRKRYKRRSNWKYYAKATAPAMGYLAKKAAEAVVKKYINTEIKYYDTVLDPTSITDANTHTWSLNLIPTTGMEGPGQDREGRQIKIISVDIQGTMAGNISATSDQKCKVELWYKGPVNGTAFNMGGCYDQTESDGTAIAATNRINAKRNMNNSHELTKLKSRTFVCEKNGKIKHNFRWYKKLGYKGGGIITKWKEDDTTGVIANMEKGLLSVLAISDQATSNYPELNFVARVRYIDN